MSRPVKNARTRTTPGGPKLTEPKGKIGKPNHYGDKANPGAGGYAAGGKSKPMWDGPSQILKDNRRG